MYGYTRNFEFLILKALKALVLGVRLLYLSNICAGFVSSAVSRKKNANVKYC